MRTRIFRAIILSLLMGAALWAPSALEALQGGPAPSLGDIVKKDARSKKYCPNVKDGEVCTMNQQNAEKYCSEIGTRLPTARELAQMGVSMGSGGISETATTAKGYYVIYKRDAKGKAVADFYYSNMGYAHPSGELGRYWFWSSSPGPFDPNSAYHFSGIGGFLFSSSRGSSTDAVRCVSQPR